MTTIKISNLDINISNKTMFLSAFHDLCIILNLIYKSKKNSAENSQYPSISGFTKPETTREKSCLIWRRIQATPYSLPTGFNRLASAPLTGRAHLAHVLLIAHLLMKFLITTYN